MSPRPADCPEDRVCGWQNDSPRLYVQVIQHDLVGSGELLLQQGREHGGKRGGVADDGKIAGRIIGYHRERKRPRRL